MSTATRPRVTGPRRAIRRRVRRMRRAVKRNILRPIRLVTSPIRVMPNFIIIGAQKCGTTSLFDYMRRHPQIARAFEKEVRFFDLNYAKGQNWYRAHFPTVQRMYLEKYIMRRNIITGEATPDYLWDPRSPQRMYETLPDTKLVVLLRNPVDRAYSHYHHEVRLGRENLSFEAAINRELEQMIPERENLIDDDEYLNTSYRRHWYLSRGFYADQLDKWSGYFPIESFHIERAEDLFADTTSVLNRVFGFLDLPPVKSISYEKRNAGSYSKMSPEMRKTLIGFYGPHNEKLSQLLGREFGWDK